MPDKDIHSLFEDKLARLTDKTSQQIREAYEQAIVEITLKAASITKLKPPFKSARIFRIKDYPTLLKTIEKAIEGLHASIYTVLVNSIEDAWELSNEKNTILLDKRFEGKAIDNKLKAVFYDPNKGALDAFLKRKDKGMNLSKRVWKLFDGYKTELEGALGVAINEGKSANKMASELKKYLNEPNKLFRRVRDANGQLRLSKSAREYHPGQGVYRSSYKNALRLTRTEVNMSYRSSDHERWKKSPIVKGIRVKLSNNHPKYDVCDSMVGVFPADYKHVGFHPQCRCYAVPIVLTGEEYDKYEDYLLGVTDKEPKFEKVTDIHKGAKDWIKENADRVKGWSNLPYFLQDNSKYVKDLLNKK